MAEKAALAPNATVVRHEPLVGCLFRLHVRPDWDIGAASWEAGQFVRLAAAIEGSDFKKEGRAYSFAGVRDGIIEFYVVEVPSGVQTPRLNRLREGDRLWCEQKISGHFTVSKNPEGSECWMVGTGAGIAPFMAMIRQGDLDRYERAVLVHQVRVVEDLTYGAELAAWVAADPRRRYVPIVSKPTSRFLVKDGHSPLFGRVGATITDGRLERVAGATFDAARSVVMLCGNPDMIAEVRDTLEARGLKKHLKRAPGNIVTERYW